MRRFEGEASDRLAHAGRVQVDLRSEHLVHVRDLERVYGGGLDLRVENVVPGQPLRIGWRVVLGLHGMDLTSFNLRILIDGKQVHERKDIPANEATVGGVAGTLRKSRDEALQHDTVVVGDPSDARSIYRVGPKTLSAEVRAEEGQSPMFVGSVRFRVVREPVDGSWWEWRVPTWELVEWKKGYALVGDFVNRSRYASIATVNTELREVRSDEDPMVDPCEVDSPITFESRNAIAASARVGLSFGLLHDWSWLMTGTYVIYGVLGKRFNYAVAFDFTDEYGNVYRGSCSSGLTRDVVVSQLKVTAAQAALLAVTNALILALAAAAALAQLITAGLAVPLFLAAGVAYGIAMKAGDIAKDPPAPDPRYRDAVEVVPLALPPWPTGDMAGSLASLWALLKPAADLLALENARTVCRARLLGARLAGDDEALEQQRSRYLEVERAMVEAADILQRVLPDAQTEAEKDGLFDSSNLDPWIDALSESGFSEAMQRAMHDAGLGRAEMNGLAALFRSHVLVELFRANGLFLASFVACLRNLVSEVRSERDAVLQGEQYVRVSDRDERNFEADSSR